MRIGFVGAGLMMMTLAGCGAGLPPSVKVAGTVTLDGKPFSEGSIRFHPADKEGAGVVVAPIVDGAYLAPIIPVGSYRVSFTAGDAPPPEPTGPVTSTYNAPDPAASAKPNPVPEKYRRPSLPADVTANNSNLNFELRSK